MKMYTIAVISTLFLLSVSGCNPYTNDDFAPYEKYTKEVNISIGECDTLLDISSKIRSSLSKVEYDMPLTEIELIFDGKERVLSQKGIIKFSYVKTYIENRLTRIIVFYDMIDKKVYKFEYEDGHGKGVGGITESISTKYSSMSLEELLEKVMMDDDLQRAKDFETPQIKLQLSFDKIRMLLYDTLDKSPPIQSKDIILE